jgi:Mg-chelatase subunit ChlD
MKNWTIVVAVALLCVIAGDPAGAKPQNTSNVMTQRQAIIDVAFCLDTTGSMADLLEGAKAKIWSIVNTVASAKPKPVLRIALVGYRDLNDTYVTRVFDFTQDLETMYSHLREYKADGGGDTPEHVNQALYESVNKLTWSKNPGALKILYLVGDAPPHMDYQDGYDYRKVSRRAAASGIIVNTIQCGNLPGTQQVWQEIAKMAEGKYAAIDQSGGVAYINSPYDTELARLSGELNKTYVAYGASGTANLAVQSEHDVHAKAVPSSAAERAATKASPLYKNESWDLVDAVREDEKKLDKLNDADMPKEIQGLSRPEQKEYLQEKQRERSQIQQKIQDVTKKRDSYVEEQRKKSGSTKDAFDSEVLKTLKEQGKDKGITFEKK